MARLGVGGDQLELEPPDPRDPFNQDTAPAFAGAWSNK